MLEPTKQAVLDKAEELKAKGIKHPDPLLCVAAGQQFFNVSRLDFPRLLDDPRSIALHLRQYIDGYSQLAREAIDKFDFDRQIDKLDRSNLLFQVIAQMCQVDLHPSRVSNLEMGYLFEELTRRFAETSAKEAGDHFTPREVVKLMVNLLLDGDEEALTQPGTIRTFFDPSCGTGGMLSEAEAHVHRLNPKAEVHLYGQELNDESYAICLADMLIKGQDASHIVFGNSLSADGHKGERFHYGIANPPFGVDWKKVEREVRDEHERLGFEGRFGPGLPATSDGQMLFLLHLLSKMRDVEDGGSRIAVVHNGSPLTTGNAGSGRSEIRRWIIENDLLEAIIALPEQLFYNTGIATYVWVLTNRKAQERRGTVQLIDARELYVKMPKTLGEKRREITAEQIELITRLHGALDDDPRIKLFANKSFGYRTVVVERPLRARWEIGPDTWAAVEQDKSLVKVGDQQREGLAAALRALRHARFDDERACRGAIRDAIAEATDKPAAALVKGLVGRCLVRDPNAPVVLDKQGKPAPDPQLRDTENVRLDETVLEYLEREVFPHAPDAWVPDPEGKIGYEIPLTRLFYTYRPPRASAEIKKDLKVMEDQIHRLLGEVLA